MSQERFENILSDYKIIKNLGEGGMGEVFLAKDLNLSRLVAIKFLKIVNTPNSELLIKRFQNEAKILASLNHPNIVGIYNFGCKNKINYIIMEYVDGMNLHEAIKSKRFNALDSTKIIKRVIRGMSEAHESGVLHRDIKPANIIVSSKDEVKIVDFGISKNLLNDDNQFTKDNHFIGTVSYMAPEIFRGEEPTSQSDIFSIGVLFYEMLTGINPFVCVNKFETIEKIKTSQITLPPNVKEQIPEQVVQIFNRMVAIDKSKRYKSSKDIYQDLRNLKNKNNENSLDDNAEVYQQNYSLDGHSDEEALEKLMKSNKPLVLEEPVDFNFSQTTVSFEKNKQTTRRNKVKKEIDLSNSIATDPLIFKKKSQFNLSNFLLLVLISGSVYYYANGKLPISVKNIISYDALFSYITGFNNYGSNEMSVSLLGKIQEPQETRSIASVEREEAYLEFPKLGSLFLYEKVVRNEKTGKVLMRSQETYKLIKPSRGIASIEIENSASKRKKIIKVTANNFLPPFEFTNEKGVQIKLKITGNYNSIYPLAAGKTMEYTAISLHTGGSFLQLSQKCTVLGEENLTIKNSEYQTYVVKCADINQNNSSETWTYYSPQLKQFVKKETRKFYSDGYHMETINLISHSIDSDQIK